MMDEEGIDLELSTMLRRQRERVSVPHGVEERLTARLALSIPTFASVIAEGGTAHTVRGGKTGEADPVDTRAPIDTPSRDAGGSGASSTAKALLGAKVGPIVIAFVLGT